MDARRNDLRGGQAVRGRKQREFGRDQDENGTQSVAVVWPNNAMTNISSGMTYLLNEIRRPTRRQRTMHIRPTTTRIIRIDCMHTC